MKKGTFRANIESKRGVSIPFLKIPFDFFNMEVPQEGGGSRFLTHTEILVLALIKQCDSMKHFEGADLSLLENFLKLPSEKVENAIRNLESADLIVRNDA